MNQSTATTPAKQPRPAAPKPVETLLALSINGDVYELSRLPGVGWRLRKAGDADANYVVTTAGGCECKGHLRWHATRGTVCRHVQALRQLYLIPQSQG